MRYVELRRHTDNEADRLTPQGAADAEMIGRGGLHPPYAAFVSTGAARATQMLEILRRGRPGRHPDHRGDGLRSSVENRWRDAAKAAGKRADLKEIRAIDPDLVERESWLLGLALRQVVAGLPCSGSPAWLSRHWARAKGFCWSRTAGTTGWSRWTRWR
jgi:hypothetical protein